MSDSAKAAFMAHMDLVIYRLTQEALRAMSLRRHFAARSAGQKRRRQRERAERTAPNLKIAEV